MTKIFLNQGDDYSDPIRFTTPGKYSMNIAVELLRNLEENGEFTIEDNTWKTKDYGNLVEIGIKVNFENVVFKIMCSYEDIFIYRDTGNKNKLMFTSFAL